MPDLLEMQIQTETEDQDTQDNTTHTHTHSDTTRHPMAYPDTKLDFEHDPELDSEDQNILTIESTGTLDNSIDNSNPTFDNVHNSSIGDCTDIKQTIDNSDIGDPNESKTETIDDNMQDQTDNNDNEDQDAMRLQHKQEIRAIDFDPNLYTQVSECADINAIRSNNLTSFNCKSSDHLVNDCPEPNKMQQPQSNKRRNNSIESAIEAPTQTLKGLLINQKSHGYSKPKQPFHHKRVNPHAKPNFKPTYRPHNNKGQYFKNNSKYQKQTAHTNAIEDCEAMYLNMCENFRAKIPDSKPIPIFSFG